MNTVSPEAFYTFQQVLMHICLWATVGLGVILFFIKVVCPGWDGIRKFFSKEGIKSIILIPSIVGICFYGMTKGGYSGHITYDGGIKSGTTSNFVSNDVIRIYWQRDISGGVWVPDAAAVYIDYREIGDNSAEWGLLAQSTVGAGSWEGSIENATNFDYNVWAYYIPPEPVHTNGVWIYKTLKDRMNANALPLRARVEINGVAIATPKEKRKDFRGFRRITDYLYEIQLDESYPDYCEQWYEEHGLDASFGGCSVCYNSPYTMRNYDWLYDHTAEVVVHIPAGEGRYASVGVANLSTNLTDSIANGIIFRSEHPEMLHALAGMTTDGANDQQLCASILVVPASSLDSGWTGTSVNALGAVRYALDHFNDPLTAGQYLASNVYIPNGMREKGYSFHYFLTGIHKIGSYMSQWTACIVEDGVMKQVMLANSGEACLTNFRLVPLLSESSYRIPQITREMVAAVDPYGTGIERFQYLYDNASYEYFDKMKNLWFSLAYDKNVNPPFPRPTEFVGATPELTLNSSDDELRAWAGQHVPNPRVRGDGTWQTLHSARYYTSSSTTRLELMAQEKDTVYTFYLDWRD